MAAGEFQRKRREGHMHKKEQRKKLQFEQQYRRQKIRKRRTRAG